jgi:hypothetical protein
VLRIGYVSPTEQNLLAMNVRPNPRYAEFVHCIRTLSPAPARWAGVTFRSVELEHASPDKILSGEGSRRFGGRWNAPGTFPVIIPAQGQGRQSRKLFTSRRIMNYRATI